MAAIAFAFIIRLMIIQDWGVEFNLSETQKGELLGVGLWPFAISMVVFSFVIDKIGYGRAIYFAFACHVASTLILVFASASGGYWVLYVGIFIIAVADGTIEAFVSPVVTTLYSREKTKWLNIAHAGWPAGMLVGGTLALALGPEVPWRMKVGLIIIPTLIYGFMLFGQKFPAQERVAAGVSYRDMLKEFGGVGAFIVVFLLTREVGRVFMIPGAAQWAIIIGVTVGFVAYVRTAGRPLFIILLLMMMPLATTELGVDSWITPLMEPEMQALGLQAGWVVVYASLIVLVLRLCAGPIVERLSPLGLLAVSSLVTAIGLYTLSVATGLMILLAATLYGMGKTFLWPTMLGVAAERFPKGGALTVNALGAVGSLAVGTIGAVFLGQIQDNAVDGRLREYDAANNTAIRATYVGEKQSIFGAYNALNESEFTEKASEEEVQAVREIQAAAKKGALSTVTILPIIMLVGYLMLIGYFKATGGYKAITIAKEPHAET
jgi:MFS family permease